MNDFTQLLLIQDKEMSVQFLYKKISDALLPCKTGIQGSFQILFLEKLFSTKMSIKAFFAHYDQAPEREKLIYVPCRNLLPE